ncbi:MAG: hypothetical protein AAFY58_01645 [Planctomycetota bacterium]
MKRCVIAMIACLGTTTAATAAASSAAASAPSDAANSSIQAQDAPAEATSRRAHLHAQRDAERAARRREIAFERDLRRINGQHFRTRDVERRQIGLAKLGKFTEPWQYAPLLHVLGNAGDDVARTLTQHLADQDNDDARAVLAWAAIHSNVEILAEHATDELVRGQKPIGRPALGVIAASIAEGDTETTTRAALLTESLALIELIPLLIEAQVGSTQPTRRRGDNAWIMVGTQTAYVADLTPVVSDSAVAFDPQIAVITEGTLLRVNDAVVVTVRSEVHGVLFRMTSSMLGRPTNTLGYDVPVWRTLWADELAPIVADRLDTRATDDQAETSPESEHARDRHPAGVRERD